MRRGKDAAGLLVITRDSGVAFVDPSAVETIIDLKEALRDD
jgi:hypothetical protein